MTRSLIAVYAAAVCFAAALCMSIAAGVALFSIVRITMPEVTSSGYQSQLQAQPAFAGAMRVMPNGVVLPPGVTPPAPPTLTPKQMEDARRNSLRMALVYERSSGMRSLILWGITFAVSGVLWLLHWRILRHERGAAA
jgi:hypothetical protein